MLQADELERMRAAWSTLRPVRPDWPATFEDALHKPLLCAILRMYARHPEATRVVIDRRSSVAPRNLASSPQFEATGPGEFDPDNAREPARPSKPPAHARRRWAGIDLKSRAAGEKPDED